MQYQILLISALAGLASAYFKPDTTKFPEPTNNAIFNPVAGNIPGGKDYKITWNPDTPGKVSIIFLQGPANNVVYYKTIADSIDNLGSFTWSVPTDIPPKNLEGYAIEIIAEDGRYQYSPQIGVSQDGTTGSSASASASDSVTASVTSYGSIETAPASSGAEGTAECGALAECTTTAASASAVSTADAIVYTSAATGTSNISSPIVSPTAPLTVPSTLSAIATPAVQTSTAVVGVAGATTFAGAQSTAISTGLAAPGAKLSGAAALVAGLLGLLAL